MVGAYNIPAARLAADGIPVFARAVLINTDALAAEMRAAMGDRPVCVLRGHGITTTGATLEQAVARALAVDSLARMACRVRRRRRDARPRSPTPTSPSSPTSARGSTTRCCGATTSGAWPHAGLASTGADDMIDDRRDPSTTSPAA